MRYVITGSTGHIGNNLARLLSERGESVVLIVRNRDDEAIAGIDAQIEVGSFYDEKLLGAVLRPGDTVFHCAGMIDITEKNRGALMKINYEGTKAVADACVRSGAKRLVYFSSVDAIEKPDDDLPISEPERMNPDALKSTYAVSKALATRYVSALSDSGKLETVVLFPTAVIGPNDFKVSNLGQVVSDFIRHLPMASVEGKYNFVDVRDVCECAVNAAQKAESGSRYIVGGSVMTIKNMFEVLSAYCGRPVPFKLPLRFVKLFSPLVILYYKARGKKPVFSKYALETLNSNCNYSLAAAQADLGYTYRSAEESIIDTAKWFDGRKSKK